MPYPQSPFEGDLHEGSVWEGDDDEGTTVSETSELLPTTVGNIKSAKIQIQNEINEWLCQTPKITSFRVNTIKNNVGEVLKLIKKHMQFVGADLFKVEVSPYCKDAIIIHHPITVGDLNLKIYDKEILVDTICGAAVLRGAHIYAPGVLAMITGTQIGDHVSVYVDLDKCKKGFAKKYRGRKIFIGNGITKMERSQLFCEKSQSGIAIQMTETISNCPSFLGDDFLPPGLALLQNLPSIICVDVLNPQPDEVILDMCASPGNKTTHIAAKMNNTGRLIAIDKTQSKISQLCKNCEIFGTKVECIQFDSTKILQEKLFPEDFFDRILLDAPCSALGKRPQLKNTITKKILRSYVPLQRKLFATAVKILKPKGTLVYSTCTITVAENEKIVAWALKNFNLELIEATPILSGPGLPVLNLTDQDLKKVQRFGPNQLIDSVGFFIAKFIKKIN